MQYEKYCTLASQLEKLLAEKKYAQNLSASSKMSVTFLSPVFKVLLGEIHEKFSMSSTFYPKLFKLSE